MNAPPSRRTSVEQNPCWADQLAAARRYLVEGNPAAAKRLANEVLRVDQGHAAAWHVLGMAAFQARQFGDAVDCLARSAAMFPAAKVLSDLGAAHGAAGDSKQAEACFQRAIDADPTCADAHYNFGKLLRDGQRLVSAALQLGEAVRLRPDFAEAWYNLGNVLRDLDRLPEAAVAYRRAMYSRPGYAKALTNLGNLLVKTGEFEEATACLKQVVQLQPHYANAHQNLGNALLAAGQHVLAETSYRQAIALRPDHAACHVKLAESLRRQYRTHEAVTVYQQALALHPDNADARLQFGELLRGAGRLADAAQEYERCAAQRPQDLTVWNNLGSCLLGLRKVDEAQACFERVLAVDPSNGQAINNLGAAYMSDGRLEAARGLFQRAVSLAPASAEAMSNLGTSLQELGEYAAAEHWYAKAIALDAQLADAHWNRSLMRLRLGDFHRGWTGYAWRWRRPEFCRANYRVPPDSAVAEPQPAAKANVLDAIQAPLWDGTPLAGKGILLFAEQGLGDTIQFIRYAPLVQARGGRVIVECQRALVPLLANCPGVESLVADGDPLPPVAAQAPLMDLPCILATTVDSVPSTVPYIHPDLRLVQRWNHRLQTIAGFRVGIHWQGNPSYHLDRRRSVGLIHFESLARLKGVRLVSLQKGFGTEQMADVAHRFEVLALGPDVDASAGAFLDTAAILRHLDLVVTSDSALAHLAGALGAPTWLLLPHVADWRWLDDHEDCPWYPTMRLFRQRHPGNWDEVFQRIAAALAGELAAKR